MKTKSIKSKVIAGLVAAGIAISTSNIAFAANIASTNNNLKTQLDTLVTAGTITSDQETAIVEALTPSNKGDDKKHDNNGDFITSKLDALVTTGTITSDQETAIIKVLTPSDK